MGALSALHCPVVEMGQALAALVVLVTVTTTIRLT